MMRGRMGSLVLALLVLGVAPPVARAVNFGGGLAYWYALGDIRDDHGALDVDGVNYFGTMQFPIAPLFKIEADLEYFPDGYAGFSNDTFVPQGFLLFGMGLYGGVGIGIPIGHKPADSPFLAGKAGLDLMLFPSVHVDLSASYRFIKWQDAGTGHEDVDGDTLIFAAALRIGI